MQAHCPRCGTLFNVTRHHIDVVDGRVRCSRCEGIFDGYVTLIDSEPKPESKPVQPSVKGGVTITPSENGQGSRANINPITKPRPNDLIYSNLLEGNHGTPRRSGRLGNMLIGVLALTALLAQLAYLTRGWLADQPHSRRWVMLACNTIPGCTIPEKRALADIKLDSRHIYGHPSIQDALIVNASFTNQAGFAQPYPVLVVSLSNVRGQEVAARRFRPEEYLKDRDMETGFASGDTVVINLHIADPGNDAMAFEIDFL